MNDIFKIIGDLGMPVAVALAGGYFVYLTIKLLLQGVLGSIKGMAGIITALDNRVKTMNHDVMCVLIPLYPMHWACAPTLTALLVQTVKMMQGETDV
jgi:hypothetical protein